ncbi:MAG: hypothetical protein KDM91_05595 [Verrucomicrobiae bacterium]|nr:hypothetical protein [Verrucomicrobiae bacterium]MCP5540513.1 hypothetical protein [Akkermansiaceae bacterium]MCP5550777.1 hypothetical protein [Akkermansiaceae bacterium]
MNLYKLTLTTIVTRKTFAIFLVLFALLPVFLPLMTPWEEKPQLIEPARAQTAWSMLWLLALGWLFYQAASFGDKWASQGVLEYLKTLGTGRLSQIGQIWLSVLTLFAGFLALVVAICLIFAMPGDRVEAKMWVTTNLQYAWLFLLVVAPLTMLAVALGTRINATAAYVITTCVALYGLFGIGYLDFFLSQTGSPLFDFLYVVSPHYHLADLTNRLVFKLGSLAGGAFWNITAYLFGLALLMAAASCLLFREKK